MAEGLLGGMADDDKYLGLLGIGLGMLAGNRGRSKGEAFSNAIGGGMQGGMGLLGPIQQNRQAQANRALAERQFGLEERKVGAQEDLNRTHAKLYGAQAADLERTAELLRRVMGQGGGGTPGGLTPGPDGTQIGIPPSEPPIQSSATGMQQPTAVGGSFNIDPNLAKGIALAKPQIGAAMLDMYKFDNPNVQHVGGVPIHPRTGAVVPGAPIIPQMSQAGLGYQFTQKPGGGFAVTSPEGALDLLAAQTGTKERISAQYATPRATEQLSGQTLLETPAQFADRANRQGGIISGKPTNQVIGEEASKAQQVKAGQERAGRQDTVFSTAYQAPQHIQRMQLLDTLLGDFEGGKFTPTGYELARAFNSAGIKIDPKLSNKEAAQALGKELTLELRSAGGSNQLPGAMSDADRQFLEQMTPSMAQSAAGRKALISARTAISQRQMDIGQMAQKYVERYGALDEQFFTQAAQYNTMNPIFKGMKMPGAK